MKKPFAVGERVRVYGSSVRHWYEGEVASGVVCEPGAEHLVRVKIDGTDRYCEFHPKQCRRLIKKQRRRIWAYITGDGNICVSTEKPTDGCMCSNEYCCEKRYFASGWSEFIEVKKVPKPL